MVDRTVQDLKEFDGRGGRPAYVAANDAIYDVSDSRLWKNGRHMGAHQAGSDLTGALPDAPHGPELLERFRKEGRLLLEAAGDVKDAARPLPFWAEKMLAWHSHPISAHFPQAFFVFAPVFLALFYITASPAFETTAYHLMAGGFLMAFPGVFTGLIHWWYKFGGKSRPIFRLKILLSALLLIISGAAVVVHTAAGRLPPQIIDWILLALYFVLIPITALLGKAGGMIVFNGKGR